MRGGGNAVRGRTSIYSFLYFIFYHFNQQIHVALLTVFPPPSLDAALTLAGPTGHTSSSFHAAIVAQVIACVAVNAQRAARSRSDNKKLRNMLFFPPIRARYPPSAFAVRRGIPIVALKAVQVERVKLKLAWLWPNNNSKTIVYLLFPNKRKHENVIEDYNSCLVNFSPRELKHFFGWIFPAWRTARS